MADAHPEMTMSNMKPRTQIIDLLVVSQQYKPEQLNIILELISGQVIKNIFLKLFFILTQVYFYLF